MFQRTNGTTMKWLDVVFAVLGIAIFLYGLLWSFLKIDLLHIGALFDSFYNKHPVITTTALTGYFLIFALKHGSRYRKERSENDLAWAILEWMYVAIGIGLFVIYVLFEKH